MDVRGSELMLEGLYGCWKVCTNVRLCIRMLEGLYGC